jgi:two-component system, OmpR family, osmolarity sensor histidine kinase EnvZ
VSKLFHSETLFGRTATAFTLAFLLFSLFSLGLVIYFVTLPLKQRSANDLSALAVLSAQIWVELPPDTRPDFELEMREHHDLTIGLSGGEQLLEAPPAFHVKGFLQALSERTGKQHTMLFDPELPDWRWVKIPMGGRDLLVGFDATRFKMRIPLTLIFMVVAGTLIATVTSLLIVRRITRPLAALAQASTRIGEGRQGKPLQEKGAKELRELTRNFNQMEQQLQVLMDNRTVMLAGISHDLRTPIARMQLELELAADKLDDDQLTSLRDDLNEMNDIISATLQLSKGFSDEVVKQTSVCFQVNEVVQEYQRQNYQVEYQGSSEIFHDMPIVAFRRVLSNLIDNAIRYSANKPVKVSCQYIGTEVAVSIIDQGPGIPIDQREIVLQPFKRLEESRNPTSGGSGLGLAIVDQLCRMNGWRFELDDAEVGGTIARVWLSD